MRNAFCKQRGKDWMANGNRYVRSTEGYVCPPVSFEAAAPSLAAAVWCAWLLAVYAAGSAGCSKVLFPQKTSLAPKRDRCMAY